MLYYFRICVLRNGFTLIELLIVIAITAILLALSMPAFDSFFQKTAADVSRLQLLRALHFARHEALSRSVNISICQSKDRKTCSGEWQQGYIVFDKQKILQIFPPQKGFIHWRAFRQQQAVLQFLPNGFSNAENGTFWYCTEKSDKPIWAIVMNKAGRTREVLENIDVNLKC